MTNPEPTKEDELIKLLIYHKSQLFGFIFAIVQSLPDAEDVFQQTSVVLWEKFDTFDPNTDFIAWACSVAKSRALNLLRTKRRDKLCFSESFLNEITDRQADQSELFTARVSALETCMDKLVEKDRELIQHCYSRSISIKEVAKQIGRPVGAVYVSLTRIRRALHDCIRHALSKEGA